MLYFMQLWHHYLEYFYSSCMEKSGGHSIFYRGPFTLRTLLVVITFEIVICFPWQKHIFDAFNLLF